MSNQVILTCFECGITYEDDGGLDCRNCGSGHLWQVPLAWEFLPEDTEEKEQDDESK